MIKILEKICFCLLFFGSIAQADTFTHYKTKDTFDGYLISETNDGSAVVKDPSGRKVINLNEYEVEYNRSGRNNIISVIPIDGQIESLNQVEDFKEALLKESEKGPLAILIEIDTPGGRIDYAMQLADAISQIKYCPSIAYVCGGEIGGAFSAGVLVTLACDEVYMATNTVIGAATMISVLEGVGAVDMEAVVGGNIAEKMRSSWRTQLAAMAEKNNRPGILAKAMEDRNIEVVEVTRDGEKMFLTPVNSAKTDKVVKTWSAKGELLTLSASDAVYCGISDHIADSRASLLRYADMADCEIELNNAYDRATRDFLRANSKIEQLGSSIDVQIKKILLNRNGFTRRELATILSTLEKNLKQLQTIQKKYPDVSLDEESIQDFINSIQALKSSI